MPRMRPDRKSIEKLWTRIVGTTGDLLFDKFRRQKREKMSNFYIMRLREIFGDFGRCIWPSFCAVAAFRNTRAKYKLSCEKSNKALHKMNRLEFVMHLDLEFGSG